MKRDEKTIKTRLSGIKVVSKWYQSGIKVVSKGFIRYHKPLNLGLLVGGAVGD